PPGRTRTAAVLEKGPATARGARSAGWRQGAGRRQRARGAGIVGVRRGGGIPHGAMFEDAIHDFLVLKAWPDWVHAQSVRRITPRLRRRIPYRRRRIFHKRGGAPE